MLSSSQQSRPRPDAGPYAVRAPDPTYRRLFRFRACSVSEAILYHGIALKILGY